MEPLIISLFASGGGVIECESPSEAIRTRHKFYRERKKIIARNPDYERLVVTLVGNDLHIRLTKPLTVTLNSGESFLEETFAANLAEELGITLEE